jgi:GNAT superfamily N-acetyltransferase
MAGVEVVFRRARRDDVAEVVALLADDPLGAAREDASGPVDDGYGRAFDAIDADPAQLLVVADAGGRVVGTLQLSFIPYLTYVGGVRAQVEAVRVAADQRGCGLGRRLLEWAVGEARARGCHLVQLTTDKRRPEAKRFYESLGFEATHEGMKLHLS